ncbi:hypothetical protein [Qipengyuania nanhaisediminis]|uniref:hypothetical protein n=1 Tax=Qipengyuania nanhaisediminis TaxID=604088 RepID=UPI0038B32849
MPALTTAKTLVLSALAIGPVTAAAQLASGTAPTTLPATASQAENVRSLNIMLMVTALRCRTTPDDFRADYERFTEVHATNLGEAYETLIREHIQRHGDTDSRRALDRIGVRIANLYGDGHPNLGCAELKQVTASLARSDDKRRLAGMARRLLGPDPRPSLSRGTTRQGSARQPSRPAIDYRIDPGGFDTASSRLPSLRGVSGLAR